jgi:hypothetical protein
VPEPPVWAAFPSAKRSAKAVFAVSLPTDQNKSNAANTDPIIKEALFIF